MVGIDWSEKLIGHARRYEANRPLGISYEVLDATQVGKRFTPASFDLITGCMSVIDMPAPVAVLAGSRGLLRPGGRIVFSIVNPVIDSTYSEWERDADGNRLALKIDRYFDAGPYLLEWNMKRLTRPFRTVQYRRTFEQWSRIIEDTGLVIDRLREPRPSDAAIARQPGLAGAARVPFLLSDRSATPG